MAQPSGSQVLGAAAVVGIAVIAGSLILAHSLDQVTDQLDRTSGNLDEIRGAVADAKDALSNLQVAAAPSPSRRGPDPNRRYTVNTEGAPALGPKQAAVTVVEFADFQCPFCRRVDPTVKKIRETYGDQVRIVFKHQPLSFHAKAAAAHAAAEAAHRQGKFWEMHDKIFGNQREMSPEKYEEYAVEIGLDLDQFKKDVASAAVKKRIDADKQEAVKLGSTGTPGFFINGRFLRGAQPFEAFKQLIDQELNGNKSA